MKSIRVATCQFSVEPEIDKNLKRVLAQIETAVDQGAKVIHFSECALSGYAGVDIPSIRELDFPALESATRQIMAAAERRQVWVLLGSTHRLNGRRRPHNCIYVINSKGQIADRYDKRFCTGRGGGRPTLDLKHYSPGNTPVMFEVGGFKCGVLICYDYRFPELYREYKQMGVEVLFQSFHNARSMVVDDPTYNIWRTIVPSTMACRAAENHFWVSANNSVTRPSRWASFTVRPDGQIVGNLRMHTPGVLITDMVQDPELFDAPGLWRASAMEGQLHSGDLVEDARSADRTCL
jgi:predicted amidohydrolase